MPRRKRLVSKTARSFSIKWKCGGNAVVSTNSKLDPDHAFLDAFLRDFSEAKYHDVKDWEEIEGVYADRQR